MNRPSAVTPNASQDADRHCPSEDGEGKISIPAGKMFDILATLRNIRQARRLKLLKRQQMVGHFVMHMKNKTQWKF